MMKNIVFMMVCGFMLVTSCAVRLTKMTTAQRTERLARERDRLSELTDPVKRTRSYIVISDILVSFASDSADDAPPEELGVLMDQYVAAIRSARDTMVASRRDAVGRPEGYRDLELALRHHARFLRDIRGQLLLDQREPLDRAVAAASSIREELLQLLFPQKPSFRTDDPSL